MGGDASPLRTEKTETQNREHADDRHSQPRSVSNEPDTSKRLSLSISLSLCHARLAQRERRLTRLEDLWLLKFYRTFGREDIFSPFSRAPPSSIRKSNSPKHPSADVSFFLSSSLFFSPTRERFVCVFVRVALLYAIARNVKRNTRHGRRGNLETSSASRW